MEESTTSKEIKSKQPLFKKRYAILAVIVVAVGIGYLMMPSTSDAKPPLGKTWQKGQRVSMDNIDHAPFEALLQKYVDDDGYVNYKLWKASRNDRQVLQNYLIQLSRGDRNIRASKEAQIAFWVNAYNAVTLEGILQVYPTSSIRKHTASVIGYNIWKDLPLIVGDQKFSLDSMEHKLLRKMEEPRIHFAIVCASVGCPRLMNHAYTAKKLDDQLGINAKDFFSRKQNFQADASRKTIHVSKLLSWFEDDFGSSQSARFGYLKKYIPEASQPLATDRQTKVKYLDYNWNLNDQAKKQ